MAKEFDFEIFSGVVDALNNNVDPANIPERDLRLIGQRALHDLAQKRAEASSTEDQIANPLVAQRVGIAPSLRQTLFG